MYRFEKMFKEGFYSCWQSKNNSSNIYLGYTVLSCLKKFTENVRKELNLFDKTIENIKNTQTLCFIVIVMISLFLISYLACEQNYRKKNSLPPPSAKKKDDKKKYNVTDYLELKIPVSCLHFFHLL